LSFDGRFEARDLHSEAGRWVEGHGQGGPITTATVPSPPQAAAEPWFDGEGLIAMPGLIDAHVHFREPGVDHKEGIDQGTRAALAGGVTTVLEMPNTVPTCSTPEALAHKRELYQRKSRVHWGLHYQATYPPKPLPHSPIASAKIYMAKSSVDDAVVSEEAVLQVMRIYPRVAVHAEDERKFCAALPPGVDPARAHHVRRPVEAIEAALATLERCLKRLSEHERPRLILCHAGTREELVWLRRMRHEGFDVWAETCPHYFLLTQDDYLRIGDDLKVNPPLRAEADRDAVLQGLADGTIDFISTDHAPHLPSEKQSAQAPSGIASIEVLLPLLMTLWQERQLPWAHLLRLAVINPARAYDLPGCEPFEVGHRADFVLLREGAFSAPPVVTRAATHPYLTHAFRYQVASTWLAGRMAFEHTNAGARHHDVLGEEVYLSNAKRGRQ
jgi:dihydroorotase